MKTIVAILCLAVVILFSDSEAKRCKREELKRQVDRLTDSVRRLEDLDRTNRITNPVTLREYFDSGERIITMKINSNTDLLITPRGFGFLKSF